MDVSPIYIVSKGRWDKLLTAKALDLVGVPYRVIVEADQRDKYARYVDEQLLLVLPQRYLDEYDTCDDLGGSKSKGPGAARNFALDHAIESGAAYHWVMDDNLHDFHRLHKNLKVPLRTPNGFIATEAFARRFANVPLAGLNYYSFCKTGDAVPPFVANTRVYSCILIRNDIGLRWRARYNEDTDLSLRVLKRGDCTIQMNAFLCGKVTTQRMKGGNTDEFYGAEGTRPKSDMIEQLHPDVAKVVWRFNRWHHHVDYSPFKANRLVLRDDWREAQGTDPSKLGFTLTTVDVARKDETPAYWNQREDKTMTAQENHLTPDEHSDLVGGSTAARRIGCPRSYQLEKLGPPDKGSSYAREGTALHEMMALILGQGKDPEELLPFTFTHEVEGWAFTVDHDLWEDKGQPALEAFDDYLDEQEALHGDEMRLLIEKRVEFPDIAGAFGTSDIMGLCGGEVYVMDWKFGHGIVSTKENKQLMFYATGALSTFSEFFGDVTTKTPVHLSIIQPASDPVCRTWSTTVGRLDDFTDELIDAVEEAKQDKARMARGEWCKFARCKTICPLHTNPLGVLAEHMQDLEKETGKPKLSEAVKADPKALDWAALMAEMLPVVEVVEDWCDEVRKQAKNLAEDGEKIEGYKLVEQTGRGRKWAVGVEELKKFFKNRKYTLDQYMPRSVISMPQAEKMLKKDKRTIPEDMIAQPSVTGHKLVREETEGDEVVTTASKVQQLANKLGAAAE